MRIPFSFVRTLDREDTFSKRKSPRASRGLLLRARSRDGSVPLRDSLRETDVGEGTRREWAADPDARIHFRYDWLRQDLERIRRGIQAHIDAPQGPGDRKTVCGDYRR